MLPTVAKKPEVCQALAGELAGVAVSPSRTLLSLGEEEKAMETEEAEAAFSREDEERWL